jgi:hypothetical protein
LVPTAGHVEASRCGGSQPFPWSRESFGFPNVVVPDGSHEAMDRWTIPRRVVGLCAVVGVAYVAVRAWREAIGSTRDTSRARPPTARPVPPRTEWRGDPIELCEFVVTCPGCGDRTRLIRWTRGPDDRPAGGQCPGCGSPHRLVGSGVSRGVRLTGPD